MKYEKYISEAKKVDPDFVAKIAKMTDKNYHSEARVAIAVYIRDAKLQRAYQAINDLHEFYGHMPHELSKLSYQMDHDYLYPRVKAKLGEDGYKQIHGAL